MILEAIRKTGRAVVWGGCLGLSGATLGVVAALMQRTRKPKRKRSWEDMSDEERDAKLEADRVGEREALLEQVRYFGLFRQAMEAAKPLLADTEYRARRRLEELGYYPCEHCGVPHLDGGSGSCLPRGAYWHGELRRYVVPGDPDWTMAGYEAAGGSQSDLGPEPPIPDPDDEPDDDQGSGGPGGVH